MCLIGILVRPNSTVSCTGMSRIMLMSLPAPAGLPPLPLPKLANCAGDSLVASTPPPSVALVSASAAAHSSAILSGLSAPAGSAFSADIGFSQPSALRIGKQSIDLDGVAATGGAVVAVE